MVLPLLMFWIVALMILSFCVGAIGGYLIAIRRHLRKYTELLTELHDKSYSMLPPKIIEFDLTPERVTSRLTPP